MYKECFCNKRVAETLLDLLGLNLLILIKNNSFRRRAINLFELQDSDCPEHRQLSNHKRSAPEQIKKQEQRERSDTTTSNSLEAIEVKLFTLRVNISEK